MHKDLKMGWLTKLFPNIKIAKGKIKIRGSSTVLSHYHYCMDPCLVRGKCAMRQIPCACIECTIQLEKQWVHSVSPNEQPRYANVDGWVYHSILGIYNKWIIMDFTRDSEADEECFE